MFNAILESIHQVLGNLVRNCNISSQTNVEKNDPLGGILAAAAFVIFLTTNRQKGYSPEQLIFGHDMILPIKHMMDWKLIRQQKQTQINRDKTRENKHTVDYDHKLRDDFMRTNHTEYKYETLFKVPFIITQCFTNGKMNLQYGTKQIMYNIHHIKPYKSDTKIEDSNSINMSDDVRI